MLTICRVRCGAVCRAGIALLRAAQELARGHFKSFSYVKQVLGEQPSASMFHINEDIASDS